MRDRLIELMHKQFSELYKDGDWNFNEMLGGVADYLLENGVIVPPCKVGQTVYRLSKEYNGETRVIEGEVFEIAITHAYGQKIEYRFYFWAKGETHIHRTYYLWCNFDEFGKTVFLTREEAEEALKRKEDEGK